MDTDQIILGFLMSGPKSGYKIKNITGRLMMAYNLSLNQIYPALRKLEAADLVRKEVVIQTGKPNKHVYSITEKGRREFLKSLVSPPIPVDYQLDFLTRAFFFRFLTREQIIEQFEKEISSLEEQLEDLGHMKDDAQQTGDENGQFIYRVIVGMLEMLRDAYSGELEKRKQQS
ncbi:MAG: PadR family transcriptional regulator [Desulfomonilia bacterium]|jgi:DNA-binding PadR family transcriptional regulator|uniref:Transcriptional regulator PadR-like family protein n=1 Tax=anaerobic digester metagenome TaxID=1263854 RepID=A0A485M2M9_9ZZZZ|nr:PadR family transcriptional regulator [Pseudomonadota bacterium]HON38985.1 PadR family transcriptional regulator [Deltaproteobacteria bacterium]HRS56965.1 PadR family transcriptional regulator [Desulfomonilia bacterium]HPD22100.1 PadR family transcriptional regulator [Deltaproteobacteria bacterium]HPX18938.1 PadR family transcriptional regulator [Deltaproteobacteria bacterium]